jgi:hypothetical protein
MYDDSFTLASQSNDDDDDNCLMSNVVDDDDDFPFMDDSQSDVNQVNDPGRIELSDYSPMSSQMPPQPSYIPTFEPSGLSPDIISRLTPADLSQNPEFMQLYNRFEYLQTTLNAYLCQRRIQARERVLERVLEWRLGVHA